MGENNGFSLIGVIDEYLEEQREERDRTKYFYISDMGKCLRMRILKRMGYQPDPLTPRLRRIFAVGEMHHAFIQELLEKKGYLVEKEGEVYWEDFELKGRFDAVIKVEDKYILYDIKSVHSRKFHYLENGEKDSHYIKQLLVYYKLLRSKYQPLEARLLYVSKDDLCIAEYGFSYNKYEMNIYSELDALRHWWKRQELPPRKDDFPNGWECKFCFYKTACKNSIPQEENITEQITKQKGGIIQPDKLNKMTSATKGEKVAKVTSQSSWFQKIA